MARHNAAPPAVFQVIGVISDTHGLLRPAAIEALAGSSVIIHAGDIGAPEVLLGLERIARVYAVRGNVDTEPWARRLPERRTIRIGGRRLLVLHDAKQLTPGTAAGQWDAVISGHSHTPGATVRDGVLYLNPGSAGPRRFRLPVTVALLEPRDGALYPRIIELAV